VPVLVDGAHAPGALALDLPATGADWYTGNLHKWAMAPRSCGILWAPAERRRDLHPTVISWGYQLGFDAEFDWVGTRDPSAWLAAPAGIAFMHDIGIDAMRTWNHSLAWGSACMLAYRWKLELPQDEEMVGCMVSVPMPERFGTTLAAGHRLKDALLYEDGIEAQILEFRGRLLWRLAAQVYNDADDVLRAALAIEKRAG
jgi:isopenicillin-N epimerase